jgi:hypothetical protein
MRVDMMGCTTACCVCTHDCLSKPCVLPVHKQASRTLSKSCSPSSHPSQSMLLNLNIPGYQLLLILPSIVAFCSYSIRECWWLGSRIDSRVYLHVCMITGMADPLTLPLPLLADPQTGIQGCESQMWVWIQCVIMPLITSTLMMETDTVSEILDCNSIFTWLITREDLTADNNMLCWLIARFSKCLFLLLYHICFMHSIPTI